MRVLFTSHSQQFGKMAKRRNDKILILSNGSIVITFFPTAQGKISRLQSSVTRNGPSGLLPKVNRAVEGYIRA